MTLGAWPRARYLPSVAGDMSSSLASGQCCRERCLKRRRNEEGGLGMVCETSNDVPALLMLIALHNVAAEVGEVNSCTTL